MAGNCSRNEESGEALINLFFLIILPLFSCGLAWFLSFKLRHWAQQARLIDIPNERSSHRETTPRGGGLSFVIAVPLMTAIGVSWLGLTRLPGTWAFLAGCLLIAVVSLGDDCWRLPILVRFGVHVAGALILIAGAGWIREVELPGGTLFPLHGWGLPLTFFWIVGLTNAYNFMDGIDGLAAGQAIIAAGTISWLAHLEGQGFVALATAILAGSVLGFLPHNWPPARIFMGDVGSAFLGFTFSGWAVLTNRSDTKPLPFMVV